jgi:hypothetical protein
LVDATGLTHRELSEREGEKRRRRWVFGSVWHLEEKAERRAFVFRIVLPNLHSKKKLIRTCLMVTSVPYLTTRAARALTRRPGKPALIPPRLSPTRSPSSCLYAASSLNSSYPSPPPSPSSSFSSALHCAPSRRLLHSSPSNPSYPSPSPPTIFALATPPGKAGVAVIRVSGPAVPEVYRRIVFRKNQNSSVGDVRLPEPRKMVLREIRIPEGLEEDGEEVGAVIDEGLVVYFKGQYE